MKGRPQPSFAFYLKKKTSLVDHNLISAWWEEFSTINSLLLSKAYFNNHKVFLKAYKASKIAWKWYFHKETVLSDFFPL